jgi:uncharacterized protein (TIGR02145 family)
MKNLFILYSALFLLSATAFGQPLQDTVVDFDGNVYHTVKIGTQIWMVENLKVTHYRNGDPIPVMTNDSMWGELTNAAYCDYNNYPPNSKIYGKLYNFYAVSSKRNLAPKGWHVPTEKEWETLEITLGMTKDTASKCFGFRGTTEGGQLKETDTIHWKGANIGATNSSGFTALPGGSRGSSGKFVNMGKIGYWWTSTDWKNSIYQPEVPAKMQIGGFHREIYNSKSKIIKYIGCSIEGFSVRCVKDN